MPDLPNEKFYRNSLRTRMKAWRRGLSAEQHAAFSRRIGEHLDAHFHPPSAPVAFYMPIGKEPDLRPLMREWYAAGVAVCLPRVMKKAAPLAFFLWSPDVRLTPDATGIAAPPPDPTRRVTPACLLIPCLGLDKNGYRLGYGGGYYDRTLAELPDAQTLGVLFSGQLLDDISPQPHDVALGGWVTEAGGCWLNR